MVEELNTSLNLIIEQTKNNFHTLAIILTILWSIFFISCLNQQILTLGIIPRRIKGLRGIFFAPFLHVNFNHLFFNSIPLVVLSNFLLMNGLNYFLWITLAIGLCSGLLLWLFGKEGLHVGASGLIAGYWALLVSDIFRQGTLVAIILGALSAYYFAGIFFSVFPKKGISWEGHLFGLVSGLFLSYLISNTELVSFFR